MKHENLLKTGLSAKQGNPLRQMGDPCEIVKLSEVFSACYVDPIVA